MQKQKRNNAHLTEFLFHKASRMKLPLSGTFELSPVCNFACRMCYVRKTAQEVKEHYRPAVTLEEWIKIAEEAREAGMLYLLITGGEPLLWPDFWILYEKLYSMGFIISINTNGSLIDEEVIQKFKKMLPKRLNITLYGAGDDTYEELCQAKGVFQKVDKAIRGLQEAKVPVKLNCSLTPHNVKDLERMVRYSEERGLVLQTTTYMFPPLRRDPNMIGYNDRFTAQEAGKHHLECYRLQYGEERYQKYLKSIAEGVIPPPGLEEACIDPTDGKIRCRAGKASFWITWDGWLTPCGMMPEPKVELRGKSFPKAWDEVTEASKKLTLSGVCNRCSNQKICHSCAAMAIAETGEASGIPQYLCEMTAELKKRAELEQNS